MDEQPLHGASEPVGLAIQIQKPEYDLMSGDKAKAKKGTAQNRTEPSFDPITAALRQLHDDVASEPIPDDFMRLLDQIDARISSTKTPS